MRVLIVKTSSLGDIVHTLPAVTDAKALVPDLDIDWVVEENFVEVPHMHPGVSRVIPVAVRRWRKSWRGAFRSGEFQSFRQELNQVDYDLIIDAQGLIKSAIVSRLATGRIVGLDRQTVREPIASLLYQEHIHIPRNLHAVERVRRLLGAALNYQHHGQNLSYGLEKVPVTEAGKAGQCPEVLLFHGTTWTSKQWPESYWRDLATRLCDHGLKPVLLWGSEPERARAERIIRGQSLAELAPKMTLVDIIRRLQVAAGVVAVDTGLGHLAAALQVPMVSLFSASNPLLTRPYGGESEVLVSDNLPCVPCGKRTCLYPTGSHSSKIHPPCFQSITPELVCQVLYEKMKLSESQ